MKMETRRTIYITTVAVGGMAMAIATFMVGGAFPADGAWWLLPVTALLIALAGRFPFKVSPQGDASMVTVPLFMAVIMLPPLGVVIAGAAGTLIAEKLLKAPARVMIYNIAHTSITGGLAAMLFMFLRPETGGLSLTPGLVIAAIAAGTVQNFISLFLLGGLITIIKGRSFWNIWKDTWSVDTLQEGALIALGLVAALITAQAEWGLILLLIPFSLGYFGFKKSVEEARAKAELAAELQEKLRELKETQAQLVQSAKLASMGTLAAGIAHEINNPTFAITGKAEIFKFMLKKRNDEYLYSPKALEDMDTVVREGMRISSIVKHLLDHSRTSDNITILRLDEVMHSAADLVKGKMARKGLQLEVATKDSPMIKGVANQIEQVFMNLLGNAVDASAEKKTILMGCEIQEGFAMAYVTDSGVGVPEDICEKIFEPFFTTKGVGNGTGLGLYICHKIVADHEGEITVESQPGYGTTFWVKLPVAALEPDAGLSTTMNLAS